jgi:hypothetical protein
MLRHSDLIDLSRELEDYTPPEEINLLDEGIDRYFGIRRDLKIESPSLRFPPFDTLAVGAQARGIGHEEVRRSFSRGTKEFR